MAAPFKLKPAVSLFGDHGESDRSSSPVTLRHLPNNVPSFLDDDRGDEYSLEFSRPEPKTDPPTKSNLPEIPEHRLHFELPPHEPKTMTENGRVQSSKAFLTESSNITNSNEQRRNFVPRQIRTPPGLPPDTPSSPSRYPESPKHAAQSEESPTGVDTPTENQPLRPSRFNFVIHSTRTKAPIKLSLVNKGMDTVTIPVHDTAPTEDRLHELVSSSTIEPIATDIQDSVQVDEQEAQPRKFNLKFNSQSTRLPFKPQNKSARNHTEDVTDKIEEITPAETQSPSIETPSSNDSETTYLRVNTEMTASSRVSKFPRFTAKSNFQIPKSPSARIVEVSSPSMESNALTAPNKKLLTREEPIDPRLATLRAINWGREESKLKELQEWFVNERADIARMNQTNIKELSELEDKLVDLSMQLSQQTYELLSLRDPMIEYRISTLARKCQALENARAKSKEE